MGPELLCSVASLFDLRGAGNAMTLRRREGDDESGWQLKIPAPDGRVEVTAVRNSSHVSARLLSHCPPDEST